MRWLPRPPAPPGEPAAPTARPAQRRRSADASGGAARAVPPAAVRRLARERLLRLAGVLVATSVLSPLLSFALPGGAYTVASGSMEPSIPTGSLAFASPRQAEVGDVVVYWSPVGAYQIHRVQRIEALDGVTYYFTRGDANGASDSFAVREEQLQGVVRGHVPFLGYLWLLSPVLQAALFGGLLVLYLGITAWDLLSTTRALRLLAATGTVLLLLLPTALAGVSPLFATSSASAGVAGPASLPMAPGTAGSAAIPSLPHSAVATASSPKLWRELLLWGCDPVGDRCTHTPAAGSFATVAGSLVRVNSADYEPAPTFWLEAAASAPSGRTVSVVLFDRTSGAAVAGSEVSTANTTLGLVRSGGFALAGDKEYQFQTKVDGSSSGGSVAMVKLLASQQVPSKTEAQVRLSSAEATGLTLFGVPARAQRWSFDKESLDGLTAVHFEAVAHVSSGLLGKSFVRLVDRTSGAIVATLEVPTSATGPTRFRSANLLGTLVADREYEVEFAMGSGSPTQRLYLHTARVIVQQAAFVNTVHYVDLSWHATRASSTYGTVGYPGRYHMDSEWDARTVFFEATLSSSLLTGTASARLHDDLAGAVVAGSELSAVGSDRSLMRSTALSLNVANATYSAQLRASSSLEEAGLHGARLVAYVKLAEPRTQDASSSASHGLLENAPANVAGKHGSGYSLDGVRQQLRVDDTSSLRPTSALTMALWYKADSTAGTPKMLQKYEAGASGYYLGLEGGTGKLTGALVVNGVEKSLSTSLPPAGSWVHAALTYDGGRVRLYVDGSEAASTGASGALTHTPAPLYVGLGSAATATAAAASLPSARDNAAAASNGTHLFVFGGRTAAGLTNQILRFDPSTETVRTQSATLPTAREHASVVWDGTHFYLFGGQVASGKVDQILRYNPVNDTLATLGAKLPTARLGTSAVYDGTHAYVFGGQDDGSSHGGHLKKIVRFTPSTSAVSNLSAELPSGRKFASAVWTGTAALLFGGVGQGNQNGLSEILQFTPSTGTLVALQETLPGRRHSLSAAWDGASAQAYLFGGCGSTCPLAEILLYNATSGTASTASASFATARSGTAASWIGQKAWVVGGSTATARLADIVRISVGASRFHGVVDEVRLYQRALSASEIASLKDGPYGTGSADVAQAPRLLGGEVLALPMDADDHFRPLTGKTYDALLHTTATGCAWAFTAEHVASSALARLDQATVTLRGSEERVQLRVSGGTLAQASGTAVAAAEGETLQHIVSLVARSSGSSALETRLKGTCVGHGIHTEQSVTYVLA